MGIPFGGDSAYFLGLYSKYLRDRNAIPADLALHFDALDGRGSDASEGSGDSTAAMLLDGYRRHGHLEAQLDPLSVNAYRAPDLERLRGAVARRSDTEAAFTIAGSQRRLSLGEGQRLIHSIYAGSAAIEADHLPSDDQRLWLYEQFEARYSTTPDEETLGSALDSVVMTDEFEAFMRKKFTAKKRFGSEGAETMIVFYREVMRAAAGEGIRRLIMGGMHRGRLATLAVAFGKDPAILAAELVSRDLSDGATFTGDVPYHLGYRSEIDIDGNALDISILPHPSHLIVVAPVALGYARAESRQPEGGAASTLCLLAHTDAAFSGQGLSAELLQIGGLAGYTAQGTVHLVVNNQIGFTTLPSEGRSSRYCTDFAKSADIPVLHVNGDDPIAVARAAALAFAWRQRFGKDIIVDLICYRRYGHNELDEPRYTQPEMWGRIDTQPSVRSKFVETLQTSGYDLADRAARVSDDFVDRLKTGFENAATVAPNDLSIQASGWSHMPSAAESDILRTVMTGVPLSRLMELGSVSNAVPDTIAANPKVRQFYQARGFAIREGGSINFAAAEALAFATLVAEDVPVRMSGQDTVRGTFSQRHLAVHDTRTGETYFPVTAAAARPGLFEVINSPLSEYGVLSFEYGHSLSSPHSLTIWEAQFGDFLNGAQVIVDQYITSAEAKWKLRSGLVVMLPHGLEGQGPDHSSARIERLAQLCAEGNMILALPTTPANLFHLLRRQVHAEWRKPLFVISPKSLLRAKDAVSPLKDMGEGTAFQPVIAEQVRQPANIRKVIMCSGKCYYSIHNARREAQLEDEIAIIRIEQIYPFPLREVQKTLAPFSRAELVWFQEEAENQGAWHFVRNELSKASITFSDRTPAVSRPPMSVCAAGSVERHEREQAELMRRVLS